MIAGVPWYVSNRTLHTDLSITTVEEELLNRIDKYFQRLQTHEKYFQRLQTHENQLANNLAAVINPKKLKRIWSCHLRGK
jgi:hypothetical protein